MLKDFGGGGVLEVVENHKGNTFRVVYVVKADAVYVLHAFQKKSKKGIKTPKPEMDFWVDARQIRGPLDGPTAAVSECSWSER
jgi:phage-related protein